MNVADYMRKHGLTDDTLDELAAPYECGDYAYEEAPVHSGSHLDAVGKKRVTVVYDACDAQRVLSLARARGVEPSEIYRDALDFYLAAQA